jgi:hypothetical protein
VITRIGHGIGVFEGHNNCSCKNCCTQCPSHPTELITQANIYDAVSECLTESPVDGNCVRSRCGPISCWDTSKVNSFNNLFWNRIHFNGDLSRWHTEQVVDMSGTFHGCEDLSERSGVAKWDTRRLTDASDIFKLCKTFDADLGNWDVSNVQSFTYAFAGATSFTGRGLEHWNVDSLRNTQAMFFQAEKFNGAISGWQTHNLLRMDWMFREATHFNQNLDQWDVSHTVNDCDGFSTTAAGCGMWSVFREAVVFNGNVSTWQVGHIHSLNSMFAGARKFNGDISGWNVSSAKHAKEMFREATNFNADLARWDVSHVHDMTHMFNRALSFSGDISHWNVSRVEFMDAMFYRADAFNGDLSLWDTRAVVSMESLFLDSPGACACFRPKRKCVVSGTPCPHGLNLACKSKHCNGCLFGGQCHNSSSACTGNESRWCKETMNRLKY